MGRGEDRIVVVDKVAYNGWSGNCVWISTSPGGPHAPRDRPPASTGQKSLGRASRRQRAQRRRSSAGQRQLREVVTLGEHLCCQQEYRPRRRGSLPPALPNACGCSPSRGQHAGRVPSESAHREPPPGAACRGRRRSGLVAAGRASLRHGRRKAASDGNAGNGRQDAAPDGQRNAGNRRSSRRPCRRARVRTRVD